MTHQWSLMAYIMAQQSCATHPFSALEPARTLVWFFMRSNQFLVLPRLLGNSTSCQAVVMNGILKFCSQHEVHGNTSLSAVRVHCRGHVVITWYIAPRPRTTASCSVEGSSLECTTEYIVEIYVYSSRSTTRYVRSTLRAFPRSAQHTLQMR